MPISQPRNGLPVRGTFRTVGETMDFVMESEPTIASGWLAYCARALAALADEQNVRNIPDDKEPILAEECRIDNRA